MLFCNKHRLPENHDCPFDLRKKDKSINSQDKPIYQDALDFMSKDFTVAKVYDYLTTNQITKSEAIDLLNYFIENSENKEIRKISIIAFKILELRSNKVYNILESCLLSDKDPEVKKTTIDIISHLYPKKSKDLLNWINRNGKNKKE